MPSTHEGFSSSQPFGCFAIFAEIFRKLGIMKDERVPQVGLEAVFAKTEAKELSPQKNAFLEYAEDFFERRVFVKFPDINIEQDYELHLSLESWLIAEIATYFVLDKRVVVTPVQQEAYLGGNVIFNKREIKQGVENSLKRRVPQSVFNIYFLEARHIYALKAKEELKKHFLHLFSIIYDFLVEYTGEVRECELLYLSNLIPSSFSRLFSVEKPIFLIEGSDARSLTEVDMVSIRDSLIRSKPEVRKDDPVSKTQNKPYDVNFLLSQMRLFVGNIFVDRLLQDFRQHVVTPPAST